MATDRAGPDHETRDHATLLKQKLRTAQLALALERLWPLVLRILCIVGLFLALSWCGLWLWLPRLGRAAGLAGFAALFAAALLPLIRFRWPEPDAVTARLDRDAGQPHRPVTASNDRLANNGDDPFAAELWRRHQQQARLALQRIKVARPDPQTPRKDPFALRAAILIAVLAAGWLAGPERLARVTTAFAVFDPPPPPVPTRLDAWIDTPAYTGRPPIFLTREAQAATAPPTLAVPDKSVMVLRAAPPGDIEISAEGGLKPKDIPAKPGLDSLEKRFTITGTGAAIVRRGGEVIARFPVSAIPDQPPTITLVGRPQRGERDTLVLHYRGDDDYGIASLEARFQPLARQGRPVRRSLMPPPTMPLTLPQRGAETDTEGTLELGDHAWAGAQVALTLVAKDDAGQEGHSETVTVTIPQRVFTDPLAKALVEQRRDLIIDPDHHDSVQIALDALLTAPEIFTPNGGTFVALRIAAQQLRNAHNDADLVEVADWLWKVALELEDGGLTDAERALREAQERMRDALDRNASPDEIKRLTQDLQRAMNQYLREMAERAQRDPNRNADNDDNQNRRTITQQDLRRMTEEIEKLAREGKTAEAQRLLEQLNKLMENMRVARSRQNMDPRQRGMSEALDELDQMTREQQELRDRTFRQDEQQQGQQRQGQNRRNQQQGRQRGQQQGQQQGQRGRQPGQQGQQGQDGGDDQADQGQDGQGQGNEGQDGQALRDRQQALRDQLGRMRERMRKGGLGDQQELSDAEDAMRDAEGALGKGQNGDAVGAQGRALDKLRQSGQKLAEQMQQEGDGNEQADGQEGMQGNVPNGGRQGVDRRYGDNGRDSDRDPLGRSRRGQLNPDSRFDEKLGLGPGERANRILEELRRRLGQTDRPTLELDYLDRLLRREQ